MADIHIQRTHTLGLPRARELAQQWATQAETEWGLRCTRTEGEAEDEWALLRSGVRGSLRVSAQTFACQLQLGFLLSAYQVRIQAAMEENLDRLLADTA
ncbi:MAG: hypothetical protein RLZZ352_1133 [Pseudomonadota bacterium]|jgi:putative polyhydroxyalkanoate system protein